MADPSTDTYVFLDRHVPDLAAGAYTVSATLAVDLAGPAPPPTTTADFWVAGERFALGPAEVHSRYPPEGSQGAHTSSLPHIALRRDTLPWERSADQAGAPWLALLLLHADEAARCPLRPLSLADYRQRVPGPHVHEHGEADSDLLQVLELDAELQALLIPGPAELAALCHVRGHLVDGQLHDSVAVVVSRRTPRAGRNTAHLVSLEGRWRDGEFVAGQGTLVSLQRWSFTCEPEAPTQPRPLADLFAGLHAAWLRLPGPVAGPGEALLARARVPLPHRFRTGESGASWYGGPLVPGVADDTDADLALLPADSADSLVTYHEQLGMLDVTFAAAWELGRLLALQRRDVTAALAAWRRNQLLAARRDDPARSRKYEHLPQVQRSRPPALEPPPALSKWIADIWRLVGIPFKYLVPDERMLPPESLRSFTVDPRWISALLDGALGLARLPDARLTRSPAEVDLLTRSAGPPLITGILLRSAAVSGWPDLTAEARIDEHTVVDPHGLPVRLSPSIVMHLFAGRPNFISLRQHPGTLHLTLKPAVTWANEPGRIIALDPTRGAATLARDLLDHTQSLELTLTWS
jgi:hypothetical protein